MTFADGPGEKAVQPPVVRIKGNGGPAALARAPVEEPKKDIVGDVFEVCCFWRRLDKKSHDGAVRSDGGTLLSLDVRDVCKEQLERVEYGHRSVTADVLARRLTTASARDKSCADLVAAKIADFTLNQAKNWAWFACGQDVILGKGNFEFTRALCGDISAVLSHETLVATPQA